ncbi:MAG: hypothetical protein EBY73_01190 [Burkholderiaceae bacterium]|nr:hypothetical protein [Burkholderiaceae bacterium]
MKFDRPNRSFLTQYLGLVLALFCFTPFLGHGAVAQSSIPIGVEQAIKRSGIPKDSISIAVSEIPSATNPKPVSRQILNWRDEVAMNPASTIKLLTTLVALDILGPKYRWKTELFTDGAIKNGTLKGNIYFVGHGDPKWIPEELDRLTKQLRDLGIQRIDGNLIFDRSAYAKQLMEEVTIDGETLRAYNVAPDPLLYAFRTLSFEINPNKTGQGSQISYTPKLARFTIQNDISMRPTPCDGTRRNLRLEIIPNPTEIASSQLKNKSAIQWKAVFSGELSQKCREITFNAVKFDPDTFLTLGFTAAWEDAGGLWVRPPSGQAGSEGTMRHRLITQLRKFLHLKKKPEARIKTGSLNHVRTISGYIFSKSGRIYAVTSFINDPKANRGQEVHDQLLTWLLEDGPDPKDAR